MIKHVNGLHRCVFPPVTPVFSTTKTQPKYIILNVAVNSLKQAKPHQYTDDAMNMGDIILRVWHAGHFSYLPCRIHIHVIIRNKLYSFFHAGHEQRQKATLNINTEISTSKIHMTWR
jgi:hypothetical protein